MNPVDEIQQAIDRLAKLREEASPFEWRSEPDGDDWARIRNYNQHGDLITEIAEPLEDDAELIVTLHRTIDALLAILRDFAERYQHTSDGWEPVAPGAVNALALARAVNGAR